MLPIKTSAVVTGLLLLSVVGGCRADVPANQPEAVVGVLVRLLNDPQADVRRTAAVALGRLGRSEATAPLVERLRDPDPAVRRHSAWALGNLGEAVLDQAGIPLVKLLNDRSESVKRAAAQALGTIGATQVMVEILAETMMRPDVETRRAAVQALIGIEAKAAYPTLVQALSDEDGRVRQGALAAIGELAEVRALPLFRDRLAHDLDVGVRSEAAYRLGKLGTSSDVEALKLAAQTDPSPTVRRWARWATAQLSPRSDSG